MAIEKALLEALADALPLETELVFYYITSSSATCPALFPPSPGQEEEKTTCESHFLTASLPVQDVATQCEVLVFGIEVVIFSTSSLRTMFVSKADSTGNLGTLQSQAGSPSIIRPLCSAFLSYLIKQRLEGPRIVLSLFARSQNQYLFPGSSDNIQKHILDDRQLIKWWCRTIDPVLREYSPQDSPTHDKRTTSVAHIIVPGTDKYETKAFFPPSAKLDRAPRWINSYPLDLIVPNASAPLRCLIPRLPDDPKARFLGELDSEISELDLLKTGKWRSVRSIDQFWELMSYRQECSAGRLVGFIWVVFDTVSGILLPYEQPGNRVVEPSRHRQPDTEQLPTPNQSQVDHVEPASQSFSEIDSALQPISRISPPPSSPLIAPTISALEAPLSDKLATFSRSDLSRSPDTIQADAPSDPTTIPSTFPLILTPTVYEDLLTYLIDETDFSTTSLAATATSTWIAKAIEPINPSSTASPTKTTSWGVAITGTQISAPTFPDESRALSNGNYVRRASFSTPPIHPSDTSTIATRTDSGQDKVVVNTLATSMIRKKRKHDTEMSITSTNKLEEKKVGGSTNSRADGDGYVASNDTALNGEDDHVRGEGNGSTNVNMLGTNLVRKKRKATPSASGMMEEAGESALH